MGFNLLDELVFYGAYRECWACTWAVITIQPVTSLLWLAPLHPSLCPPPHLPCFLCRDATQTTTGGTN